MDTPGGYTKWIVRVDSRRRIRMMHKVNGKMSKRKEMGKKSKQKAKEWEKKYKIIYAKTFLLLHREKKLDTKYTHTYAFNVYTYART